MSESKPAKPMTARIPTRKLKLGMYVAQLDRPWLESPFTVHGFRLRSEEQLQLVQELCDYVYVAVKKKTPTTTTPPRETTDASGNVVYDDSIDVSEELPRAKAVHQQAKGVVKELYSSLRLGQSFDTEAAKATVTECVDSIIANPNAMMWLGLLKHVDDYTAEHSLNVSLLSIVLGRALGLNRADLEAVGLCGLLHDMGKAQIPLEILNKEGALDDEEFEIIKTHTTLGYRILQAKSDISAITAEVAYSHHERLNGRGYPRGLKGDEIGFFSRIVAITDTYDAITSQRCYSKARSALEGLQILMGATGSHYDAALVETFVKCIGIYPAGSIAELSTGEVGIVLPSPNAPQEASKVLVVRDAGKKPCTERMLNLASNPVDERGQPIKIRNLLSEGMFGISLRDHHGDAMG